MLLHSWQKTKGWNINKPTEWKSSYDCIEAVVNVDLLTVTTYLLIYFIIII